MSKFSTPFSLSASAIATALLISACGGGSAPADTTPPTLAITDNVSAATATGPVTFTFTFSEDVGTSFVVEDISVAGGTAGTLTKTDATHYALVVTPTANVTGTINVGVAAAKFKDLALNDNLVAASATQDFNTAAAPTATVLATFDEATAPTFAGFNGAEGSSIAAGPSGGSGNALKILRSGGESWAGAEITGIALNVTATNNTFSARVYSPEAGIKMDFKLEGSGSDTGDIAANETVAIGWQTLTWTIPALKIGPVRTKMVFLPNNTVKGTGQEYYFDDIKLGSPAAVVTTPAPIAAVLATFDEATPPTFLGFNGAEGSSIAAGPSGGSGNALKVLRSGGESWAGAEITGIALNVTETNNTFSARVYSPEAGIKMDFKLEGSGSDTGDITANEAVAIGWQTLTWTIPALKIGPVRTKMVFLPNNTVKGTGQEYYFDDIKLGAGTRPPGVVGCTPTATAASPNFVTFDGDCSILTAFEGISSASVVADPAGGTNMVAKVVKPAGNTPAFYAGVTMSNGANGSIPTIPFTSSSAKMSVRVYTANIGTRVRLKMEKAGEPGINVEHDAYTTVANGWETLVFNLTDTSTHFIPNGATTYDTTKPTANFVLTNVYNKANIFFDFGLGGSGYAAMPAERTYYFDDLKFVP